MARFEMTERELKLTFSPLEKLGALRAGASVPLEDVASVEVAQDPWTMLSGIRVGTGIPHVIVLGTMVRSGTNDVVAVYGRNPAVVVTLKPGSAYQRLIATVPAPNVVADAIAARAPAT